MITSTEAIILTQKATIDEEKRVAEALKKFKEIHKEEIEKSFEMVEDEIREACSKQRYSVQLPTAIEFATARKADLSPSKVKVVFKFPWCSFENSDDTNIRLYKIVRDELIKRGFVVENLSSARLNGSSETISWRGK